MSVVLEDATTGDCCVGEAEVELVETPLPIWSGELILSQGWSCRSVQQSAMSVSCTCAIRCTNLSESKWRARGERARGTRRASLSPERCRDTAGRGPSVEQGKDVTNQSAASRIYSRTAQEAHIGARRA